jgi:small-conductance mechanosensitive channel
MPESISLALPSAFVLDDRLSANLVVVGLVLTAFVLVWIVANRLLTWLGERAGEWLAKRERWKTAAPYVRLVTERLRRGLSWTIALILPAAVAAGLGYHACGGDIQNDVYRQLRQLTWDQLSDLGLAAAGLVCVIVVTRSLLRGLHSGRTRVEARVARWFPDAPEQQVLPRSLTLLEWYAATALILGAIWLAGHVVPLPPITSTALGFLFRLTSIVVVARLLVLGFQAATQPLMQLGDRHLSRPMFVHYWERVARLLPLTRRCFEWAVYGTAATLCIRELGFNEWIAAHAVGAIKCIGLFFGARVLIELGSVLLNETFGLYDEQPRSGQQGQTLVPLLQSASQYVIYFGAFVMGLDAFGVNATPIFAAMGVVGLAAGLGAQSLVNDVVSGFFILFEGQYLVGDYVQVGSAKGIVEAVAVRHTRIRDEQGKLYIIPNGSVKEVINYSKGFVNAIVELKVPARSDVEAVMRAMTEVGQRLRATRPEVLGETVVQGVVDFNLSDLTVRAVTKVRPGTHGTIQNEFRRQLREQLREQLCEPSGALLSGDTSRAA